MSRVSGGRTHSGRGVHQRGRGEGMKKGGSIKRENFVRKGDISKDMQKEETGLGEG